MHTIEEHSHSPTRAFAAMAEEIKEEFPTNKCELSNGSLVSSKVGSLLEGYINSRQYSLNITSHLSAEDQMVQSMPDCSPTKWHLAHVTWFFETFILIPSSPDYVVYDKSYMYLFNSYYESIGKRQPRPQRGMLTRPSLSDVLSYRGYVDKCMKALLENENSMKKELKDLVVLGLAHEQQHQELIFMDVLNLFSLSSVKPVYSNTAPSPRKAYKRKEELISFSGGIREIGNKGRDNFAFDNEFPRHKVRLLEY